uniref:Uncharacterized protein n=1 Tax=Brassica oleracea TaxID=3712 RepID=A0A3P6EIE8_BRAOL|nr:unnamed protein product [Brassica oleracea]
MTEISLLFSSITPCPKIQIAHGVSSFVTPSWKKHLTKTYQGYIQNTGVIFKRLDAKAW